MPPANASGTYLRQAGEKRIEPVAGCRALSGLRRGGKGPLRISAAERSEGGATAEQEALAALQLLATAREPVDKFFDKVMVMVEDQRVRANRWRCCGRCLKEFSTIADFSEIVTEGKA